MFKEILTVICAAVVISGVCSFLGKNGKMSKTIKFVITVMVLACVVMQIGRIPKLFSCDGSFDNELALDESSIDQNVSSRIIEEYKTVVEKYIKGLLDKKGIKYNSIDVLMEKSHTSEICVKYIYIDLPDSLTIPDRIKREIEEYSGVECLIS